ncbi:MAG: L,D-transpeptidase family protein [Bdellovibrio sp.]|nr:L,D-transpeptidase family protein [Bdellovibrio sp.]
MMLKKTWSVAISILLSVQCSMAQVAGDREQIRNFTTNKSILKAGSALFETDDLNRLYEQRGYEPIWVRDGVATPFAAALKQMITTLSEKHGLIASDYWNSELESYFRGLSSANAVAFELAASEAFISIADHLSNGRLEPSLLDNDVRFTKRTFNEHKVLAQAVSATPGMMGDIVDSLAPEHRFYKQTLQILADLYKTKMAGGFVAIKKPAGNIASGAKNAAVPAIRERMIQHGYTLTGTGDVYDTELSTAVQELQKENAFEVSSTLKSDSGFWNVITPSVESRIAQVEANLEKLRWLPKKLEPNMIFANINSTEVKVYENNKEIKNFRSINGRVLRRTPMMRTYITRVIFNPRWTATDSVVIQDKLPHIQANPAFLESIRMKVYNRSTKELVDPKTLDWVHNGRSLAKQNMFVMDPGPKNALGVFKFPLTPDLKQPYASNPDDIFMHFTDDPSLFNKTGFRHLSSGCVRLEMAEWLAGYLLRNVPGYDSASIKGIISKGTPNEVYKSDYQVMVPESDTVAVYTVPLTVEKTSSGKVRFMKDNYLHDRRIQTNIMAQSLRSAPVKLSEQTGDTVKTGLRVNGEAGPTQQFGLVLASKCTEPNFTNNPKSGMRVAERRCEQPVQLSLNAASALPAGDYIVGFENSMYPGFVKVKEGAVTNIQLMKISIPEKFAAKDAAVKIYRDMTSLTEQKKVYFEKFYFGRGLFRQTIRKFGDFYLAGMGDIDMVGSASYSFCSENNIGKLKLVTDVREQAKFVCESYNAAKSMMDYADLYKFGTNGTYQEAFADYPGDIIPKQHLRYLVATPVPAGSFVSVMPGVYRMRGELSKVDVRQATGSISESYPNQKRSFGNSQTGVEDDDTDLSAAVSTDPAAPVVALAGACASASMWRTNNRSYCTSDATEGCGRESAKMCQEVKLDLRFRK